MKFYAIIPAALVLTLAAANIAGAQTTSPAVTNPSTSPAVTNPSTSPMATSPSTPRTDSGAPVVSGTNSATNNAVNTKPANNTGAPVSGANSFTQSETRRRMEKVGFTKVTGLKLDPQGVWRGMAMKSGKSVGVSMDYQGNVVSQ